MTIPFSTRISVPPDVLVSALAGESVLLNLKSEKYFGLDEIGTRMWSALASSDSIQQAYETLLAEYRGSGVRLTLVSPGPTDTAVWDPFDPDRREGFMPRADMLRPADVAEAVVFVATRPAHVHIDWLRLGPNIYRGAR